MKKAKKILTLVACAVLLVCISVGATIAYLTSTTEIVQNTFTVGSVNITLDEAAVTQITNTDAENYGDYVENTSADRIQGFEYDLHPGITAHKDPTVHVAANSENCYVVAKITVTATDMDALRKQLSYDKTDMIGFQGIVTGGVLSATGYVDGEGDAGVVLYNDDYILTQQTNDTTTTNDDGTEVTTKANVFYVYFKDVVAKNADVQDLEIFNKIQIPDTWGNDEMAALAGLNIDVIAYAVQEDGFADVVDAFSTAFPNEYTEITTYEAAAEEDNGEEAA